MTDPIRAALSEAFCDEWYNQLVRACDQDAEERRKFRDAIAALLADRDAQIAKLQLTRERERREELTVRQQLSAAAEDAERELADRDAQLGGTKWVRRPTCGGTGSAKDGERDER